MLELGAPSHYDPHFRFDLEVIHKEGFWHMDLTVCYDGRRDGIIVQGNQKKSRWEAMRGLLEALRGDMVRIRLENKSSDVGDCHLWDQCISRGHA